MCDIVPNGAKRLHRKFAAYHAHLRAKMLWYKERKPEDVAELVGVPAKITDERFKGVEEIASGVRIDTFVLAPVSENSTAQPLEATSSTRVFPRPFSSKPVLADLSSKPRGRMQREKPDVFQNAAGRVGTI